MDVQVDAGVSHAPRIGVRRAQGCDARDPRRAAGGRSPSTQAGVRRRPSRAVAGHDSAEDAVLGFEHAAEGASAVRAAHLRAVEEDRSQRATGSRLAAPGLPSLPPRDAARRRRGEQEEMRMTPTTQVAGRLVSARGPARDDQPRGGAQEASAPAAALPRRREQPPAPTADVTEYPNYGGEVDCENDTFNGRPYAGNLKKISAPDARRSSSTSAIRTSPSSRRSRSPRCGIDDADYLIAHGAATASIVDQPNGTGPYKLDIVGHGQPHRPHRVPRLLGRCRPRPRTSSSAGATSRRARSTELLSGTVDGIDNPGKDDMPTIEDEPRPDALSARRRSTPSTSA